MNEDLANIQYSPIRDYKYSQWFREVQYNGKTLSDAERKEFVAVIDETIAQYSEGLPLMYDTLESSRSQHDEYHQIDYTVTSVMQFVLITMIDSMVAGKYFIMETMTGALCVENSWLFSTKATSDFMDSTRRRTGNPSGIACFP